MEKIIYAFEILGLIAFAATGAMAANRKDLDLIGCLVVSILSGIGGGTFRDLILSRPVFWINDPFLYSLNTCILTGVVVYAISRFLQGKREVMINWLDALGLALFSVQGFYIGHLATSSFEVSIICGVLTGVGGGVLRDICLTRQPFIFRGELYASASVLGLMILYFFDYPLLAGAIIFALRAGAITRGWKLK